MHQPSAHTPLATDAGVETSPTLEPIAFSPRQIVEMVGVSDSTVRRWVRGKCFTVRYAGSSVLIDAASFREFYESLPTEKQVERECAANRGRNALEAA
ncbi:helix-turn-helix domain-containing protein [Nocardia wallacei]|uniref:helix-turn-helix domain-containing protein n=1 Tax=Nocardia wallacei TaxID=480035 RepID=UPI0024585793|nr:helix-turn-helix domain-containing protein [Nocardia wallacei]